MATRAAELVQLLGLEPHPEGGHFREVYRSTSEVWPKDERPPRPAITTIFYLLEAGQHGRWHRVRSDEIWHLYEGGPLELLTAPPDVSSVERTRIAAAGADDTPVAIVPAGWWQAVRPIGEYALSGCSVGPGFDFADFRFLSDDPAAAAALASLGAEYSALL